jgi:hypothetical protein
MSESQQQTKTNESRPRRGSLPDLKSSDKSDKSDKGVDKKAPTGPRANPLYKTRLCMNFQSTGICPYTDKCQFAHGVKELEKWESWRTTHKSADDSKKEGEHELDPEQESHAGISEGSRSRSSSLGKSSRGDSLDLGSPQSLNWDVNTPVKPVRGDLDDSESTPVFSAHFSNFSLWSSILDDIENDHPLPNNLRARSATYDNMSQLRDAPTLFPSPPVLPSNSKKLSLSN